MKVVVSIQQHNKYKLLSTVTYIVNAQHVIITVMIILHTNLEYLPGCIFQLLLIPQALASLLLPPQSLLVHFSPY